VGTELDETLTETIEAPNPVEALWMENPPDLGGLRRPETDPAAMTGEGGGEDPSAAGPATATEEPPAEEPPAEEPPAEEEAPAEEPPAAQAQEQLPEVVDLFGQKLSRAEAEQLLDVYDWIANLTPDQARQIAAITQVAESGQASAAAAPAQASMSSADVPTTFSLPEFDEFDDPNIVAAFKSLQAQNAALESRLTALALTDRQRAEADRQAALIAARDEVVARYGLSADQTDELLASARANGLVAATVARLGENASPQEVYTSALDQTMWVDPSLRAHALARHGESVSGEREQELAAIQARNADKVRRSAAVATPTAVSRVEPSPKNMSQDQRLRAMEQEIAQAMGG